MVLVRMNDVLGEWRLGTHTACLALVTTRSQCCVTRVSCTTNATCVNRLTCTTNVACVADDGCPGGCTCCPCRHPQPAQYPWVESLVASFISKVDACQSSVDRLTSMVEAELAAALADTTSALAVCRLQVGTPAQPLCHAV
jgi:hypothetical protein